MELEANSIIVDHRLDRIQLLKDKSLSLTDITYDLGFSSPSHFTRYVQKNLGVSPTTFRE